MADIGATIEMPPKKKSARVGRPTESEPLITLTALKGTREFEAWLDELVEHSELETRSLLIKSALKLFAESKGFTKPRPKR